MVYTLTEHDEMFLLRFERRILRRIFGAVQDGQNWRQRTNYELMDMYKVIDVVHTTLLKWADSVELVICQGCHKRRFQGRF